MGYSGIIDFRRTVENKSIALKVLRESQFFEQLQSFLSQCPVIYQDIQSWNYWIVMRSGFGQEIVEFQPENQLNYSNDVALHPIKIGNDRCLYSRQKVIQAMIDLKIKHELITALLTQLVKRKVVTESSA